MTRPILQNRIFQQPTVAGLILPNDLAEQLIEFLEYVDAYGTEIADAVTEASECYSHKEYAFHDEMLASLAGAQRLADKIEECDCIIRSDAG